MALADQLVKEIVHAQMSFGQVIPLTPFLTGFIPGTQEPLSAFSQKQGLAALPLSWFSVGGGRRIGCAAMQTPVALGGLCVQPDSWRRAR